MFRARWILSLLGLWIVLGGILEAAPVIQGIAPQTMVVESGSVDGRAILKGTGLEDLREVRGVLAGVEGDYVVGRPIALPDGNRELRILVRPDAPLGRYGWVASGPDWKTAVPGTVEVVAPGDPRAQMTAKGQDLNEAARRSATGTLVVDRDQVPVVNATYPDPLVIAPDGQARVLRLAGKNLERVTEVRIRKEQEPPRYRQNQGKLPFSLVDGMLDVRVVSGKSTAMGTRYAIDLMVEKFRAATVVLEIGHPPPAPPPQPPPTVPETTTPQPPASPAPPPGPRVIELPGPKPIPGR